MPFIDAFPGDKPPYFSYDFPYGFPPGFPSLFWSHGLVSNEKFGNAHLHKISGLVYLHMYIYMSYIHIIFICIYVMYGTVWYGMAWYGTYVYCPMMEYGNAPLISCNFTIDFHIIREAAFVERRGRQAKRTCGIHAPSRNIWADGPNWLSEVETTRPNQVRCRPVANLKNRRPSYKRRNRSNQLFHLCLSRELMLTPFRPSPPRRWVTPLATAGFCLRFWEDLGSLETSAESSLVDLLSRSCWADFPV